MTQSINILKVQDVTELGFGISELNGKKVFIDGAYIGETVKAEIVSVHPTYFDARVIEILQNNPCRIEPACENKKCGGCPFLHINYKELLRIKNCYLKDCFQKANISLSVPVPDCIGLNNYFGYRNKSVYYVRNENGIIKIGFFEKNSHKVTPIKSCVMEPSFVAETNEIIEVWSNEFGVTGFDEKSGKGVIKNIVYRSCLETGESLVSLVVTTYEIPYLDILVKRLAEKNITGIWLCQNLGVNNNIWTDELRHIYGKSSIRTVIEDLYFEISPRSFMQINSAQCVNLYHKIVEFAQLSKKDIVFDLYCGIGTISLFLARIAGYVYGIEIIADAVKNAKRNAELNQINNVDFIAGKCEIACEQLVNEGKRASVVVVDPPRSGCDKTLINTLCHLHPEKIIYVSCNPKSLTRDIKVLDKYYEISQIATFDMFPCTLHVETVVLLSKVK